LIIDIYEKYEANKIGFGCLFAQPTFNPRDPFHDFNMGKLMELKNDVELIYKSNAYISLGEAPKLVQAPSLKDQEEKLQA